MLFELVTVRKVRLTMKAASKCSFPVFDTSCGGLDLKSDLLSGWDSVKKFCGLPRQISQNSSGRATSYMQAGAEYMHRMSELLKASVNSLRSTSLMDAPEGLYSELLYGVFGFNFFSKKGFYRNSFLHCRDIFLSFKIEKFNGGRSCKNASRFRRFTCLVSLPCSKNVVCLNALGFNVRKLIFSLPV